MSELSQAYAKANGGVVFAQRLKTLGQATETAASFFASRKLDLPQLKLSPPDDEVHVPRAIGVAAWTVAETVLTVRLRFVRSLFDLHRHHDRVEVD